MLQENYHFFILVFGHFSFSLDSAVKKNCSSSDRKQKISQKYSLPAAPRSWSTFVHRILRRNWYKGYAFFVAGDLIGRGKKSTLRRS